MNTPAVATLPALPDAAQRSYTPEDLLEMIDDHRYELVDGQLEERAVSVESSRVAARLMRMVGNHAEAHKLGDCYGSDCGLQIFPQQPNKVRFADGSFIAKGRLTPEQAASGHLKVAPDLAIEAVSPNEKTQKTEAKRLEYKQAGVKLLWILFPETRSVHVYRQTGQPTILGPDDELTGEDVLPGFVCKVAELFGDVGSGH